MSFLFYFLNITKSQQAAQTSVIWLPIGMDVLDFSFLGSLAKSKGWYPYFAWIMG